MGINIVKNNLLFNFVCIALDHGNFDSWDIQPYMTTLKDGKTTSEDPAESFITQNLIVGNYHHSVWPIDHDDSSCYTDRNNVIVYGGFKNLAGHSKVTVNNLNIYPMYRGVLFTQLILTVHQAIYNGCKGSILMALDRMMR